MTTILEITYFCYAIVIIKICKICARAKEIIIKIKVKKLTIVAASL